MSRPSRGPYRFTDIDLVLGEQLVAAAMTSSSDFAACYDAAQLGARRRKVLDLHLLLVVVAGGAARLRFPVQRRRPPSGADIEDLVARVLAVADPDLLDATQCRRLMRFFVHLDSSYDDPPSSMSALYTAAITCSVTVQRSMEKALIRTPDWQRRYRLLAK